MKKIGIFIISMMKVGKRRIAVPLALYDSYTILTISSSDRGGDLFFPHLNRVSGEKQSANCLYLKHRCLISRRMSLKLVKQVRCLQYTDPEHKVQYLQHVSGACGDGVGDSEENSFTKPYSTEAQLLYFDFIPQVPSHREF